MIETTTIYTILVCPKGHPKEAWKEEIKCKGDQTPFDVILEFNHTLKHHEHPRAIVKILSETEPVCEHEWRKSNMVTLIKNGRMFDTYKCVNCGITSKRFGLSGSFVRDSKFKNSKFQYCKPK